MSGWPNDIHVEQFDDAVAESTNVKNSTVPSRVVPSGAGKKSTPNGLFKLVWGRSQQSYSASKPNCYTNRPFTRRDRFIWWHDMRANNARMSRKIF